VKRSRTVPMAKYYPCDHIKIGVVGGTWQVQVRGKLHTWFWWERDHLNDLSVDGRITLKC
jgi:hypothetical protein